MKKKFGFAIQSRTGHSFIKHEMRKSKAVYGGEMSGHHYFRDFSYCDSGILPCFLVIELLSTLNKPLSQLLADMYKKFPSSGEQNFMVKRPDYVISKIVEKFEDEAKLDITDGVSLEYDDWRFNIRKSNTEPLIRLNVECKGLKDKLNKKVSLLSKTIKLYQNV